MEKPFVIYRSSAGSGKTYTLAREYVGLALRSPDYFTSILAVTFTNKAAEEMKSRVLAFLEGMASGQHELLAYFSESLGKDEVWLQQQARQVLIQVLHQYSRFSISTIDTFFHKVVRHFAREIGIQGGFQIEMDTDLVLETSIGMMLADLQLKSPLAKWLTQFARARLQEGKSYEFKSEIGKLARLLFTEQYKQLGINLSETVTLEGLQSLQQSLFAIQASYEQRLRAYGEAGVKLMQQHGLGVDDFKGKGRGGMGTFFQKIANGEAFSLNTTQSAALLGVEEWYPKNAKNSAALHEAIASSLYPLFLEMNDFCQKEKSTYQTANAINQYLFTFGILQEISQKVGEYKEENDLILISDLPDFLRKIIKESDAPFIYEKFGSRYQHFLIDEFQDTSSFQWDNFRPLVENSLASGNFNMIVGDVKQSIYRWRGGDWRLLLEQVKADIGEAMTHEEVLNRNFRSLPGIIDFNNKLYQQLATAVYDRLRENIVQLEEEDRFTQEIATTLQSYFQKITKAYEDVHQEPPNDDGQHGLIQIAFEKRGRGEDSFKNNALPYAIAKAEELQSAGYKLSDIAFLVRNNGEAKLLVDAFLEKSQAQDSPYRYDVVSADAMYLYNSYVVNFLIALFTYILDDRQKISLVHIAHDYQRYILKNQQIYEHQVLSWTDPALHLPSQFIEKLPMLRKLPLFELVETLIRMFSLQEVEEEWVFLQAFQDAILDYSKSQRGDLYAFMEWWEMRGNKRSVQLSSDADAMQITTVHKSKGLQYAAVVMPICQWAMDHDTSKDNILWVSGEKSAIKNAPPVIPLKYTAGLDETQYIEEYLLEQSKAYMENLNLLYVATTRAESVLMLRCELPGNSSTSFTSSKLLHDYVINSGRAFDENGVLEIGCMPTPKKKKVASEEVVTMHAYPSSSWQKKISIRKKSQHYFDEIAKSKAGRGIIIHELLAQLKDVNDLAHVMESAHAKMELGREDMDMVREWIIGVVTHPEINGWFAPGLEVKREVAVLLPDGVLYRIDRVILDGKKATVIDFKTGLPTSADSKQVKNYLKVLSEMGYDKVEGYLIYLADLTVEKVA